MLLDIERSCLLIIDVQEKLTPHIAQHQSLLDNLAWLLELANTLDVPVLASEQYPQGLGPTVKPLQALVPSENFITKTQFSYAANTQCCQRLIQEKGHDHAVVAGIEAHVCVLQSALQLKESGKTVFVVVDAIASRSPEDKKIALQRMQAAGIHLVTREMVLFEWLRDSMHPKFKAISKKFLQNN